MARAWLMELDNAIFKGIIPVMVYRKCLRHPNQPSHINGGDNVRMLDGSSERKQSSLSSTVAPRRPPLRKPHPVWTTTAIRAVAPAADEVVAIRRPPNQAAWKPCCSRLCVYCRAITHDEELRRRSLIEVSITLLKIVEKYYDILNSSQEVSGISGYFP